MRLLFYYISHTFINSIKKLFRTWVAILIGVIVLFGVIGGLGCGVLFSLLDDNQVTESTEDTEYIEETSEDETLEMSKHDREIFLKVLTILIAWVIFIAMLYHICTADKGGTNFFTMPDVNLLFPAPLKPQSVLLFKIVIQMGMILIASFYLIFQFPNLMINLGLSIPSILTLVLCYIMTLICCKLITIFVYTITATKTKLRRFIKPLGFILLFIPVGLYFLLVLGFHKGLYETAILLFASKGFFALPMLGWITGLAAYGLLGNWSMVLLFLALTVFGFLFLTYFIWNMKADFYEDALTSATLNSEKLEAAKTGKKKQKHSKHTKSMEGFSEENSIFHEGARAFFDKTAYNRKRFAKLQIFSSSAFFYLVPAIFIGLLEYFFMKSHNMTLAGCFIACSVFIRNFGNPLSNEFETNYLFLVPESPHKKIFYALLGSCYECFLDLLPAFMVTQLFHGDKVYMVAFWMLFLVSFDFFCSATGFFIEMVLPVSLNDTIKTLFQLSLKMLALTPIVVALIICGVLSKFSMTLLIATIFNVFLGVIITCAVAPLLHYGRT